MTVAVGMEVGEPVGGGGAHGRDAPSAADSLQRAKDNLQLERDAALQNAANERNRLDAQVRGRDRGSDRDLQGQGARVRACRECRDRPDLWGIGCEHSHLSISRDLRTAARPCGASGNWL